MAERFHFKVTGKKPKVSVFQQSALVSVNCLSCLRLKNFPLFHDIPAAICHASILEICPCFSCQLKHVCLWYLPFPLLQSSACHLTYLCLRHLPLLQSSACHLHIFVSSDICPCFSRLTRLPVIWNMSVSDICPDFSRLSVIWHV
jgi:hypothetical protein